ncbi:MAG TPA: DUF4091 domain-containing protein [Anaeromyxobacteraceae bacterium]|nr:DUF4091 domain-containing protein [Anaeromyxobacteraceae bacterium]
MRPARRMVGAQRALHLRPVIRVLTAALAALVPALAGGPYRAAPAAYGVATSLDKLRPADPLPAGRRIALEAPRGACASAQVAVKPPARLTAFTASAEPLRGGGGITPALYRVATVPLARGSGPDGADGPWPDPLVPERDAFFGEARRAFPVEVPADSLQAVWVELCVPRHAAAGLQRGEVRLANEGRTLARVPVALEVLPFALPARPSFTVTMGLPTRTGTKALGRPDDPEIARALAAAALRHGVSPYGLSYDPPGGRCTAERCELDWRAYDAEVGPVLDGTLVPGVKGGFADLRVPWRDWTRPDADLAALFRAWRAHFEARGWSDRLWLYTLDEPKKQDLGELARRARLARASGVRVFVTSVPLPELTGLVDAFAPNVFFFDGRRPDAFRLARGPGATPGRPFWYASCMSHGCDEIPAAEGPVRREMMRSFRGWPGYAVDRPGAAVLAMGWLGWREGVAGELYYDMLQAWDRDPWADVRRFAGNGDGTLLYPGLPSRLGGTHPFPVESIRLKLVREAIQDRALLELAEARGLGPLAARLAERIAPGVRGFARESGPWIAARRELLAALAARERTAD